MDCTQLLYYQLLNKSNWLDKRLSHAWIYTPKGAVAPDHPNMTVKDWRKLVRDPEPLLKLLRRELTSLGDRLDASNSNLLVRRSISEALKITRMPILLDSSKQVNGHHVFTEIGSGFILAGSLLAYCRGKCNSSQALRSTFRDFPICTFHFDTNRLSYILVREGGGRLIDKRVRQVELYYDVDSLAVGTFSFREKNPYLKKTLSLLESSDVFNPVFTALAWDEKIIHLATFPIWFQALLCCLSNRIRVRNGDAFPDLYPLETTPTMLISWSNHYGGLATELYVGNLNRLKIEGAVEEDLKRWKTSQFFEFFH